MASAKPKVTLYWLEKSRSHRILWLLEELKVDYELKTFKRGKDMLAGPELKEIHPLGKSPVISVDIPGREKPMVVAESGDIVEFICENYGSHLIPQKYQVGKENQIGGETESWLRYRYFMHYAEGSLMSLLIAGLLTEQIKTAPVPFFIKPITKTIGSRIESAFLNRNFETHFEFLEKQLATSPDQGEFFCGKELTGADVMLIFPLQSAMDRVAGLTREKRPKIAAWIDRIEGCDAYKRAIKKVEDATGEKFNLKL